jgi:ABC-type transporter Mla MlaB component
MPSSQVLKFGSSLSIRDVGKYAAQIRGLLNGGVVELDLKQVETIDTAGMQLLLAVAAAAESHGFRLKLHGAQALQTGAARSLGLEQQLCSLAEILP